MGIEISASTTSFDQTTALKQNRESFSSLISAATSGDVDAAKSAYASLTANRKPPADSPLAALGTAIDGGDATAVKGAAETLQKARKGHHHHRTEAPAQISTVQSSGAVPSISTVQRPGAPPAISTVQPTLTTDGPSILNILA